jgi:L-talarate/galactarate dehydratase
MTADTAIGNPLASVPAGEPTTDRIRHVKLSTLTLPLDTPISDAKVLTGRQKPMTEIVLLFAEITTEAGYGGIGFSYSKRAGGPAQYAHAKEVADGLLGEDPNDIGRVYQKLLWAGPRWAAAGLRPKPSRPSTSPCTT